MDAKPPLPTDGDGRDARGRFAKGNAGGPGNPHAAQVGQLRRRLLQEIKSSDIELAIRTMREVMRDKGAKDADRLRAAETLLERALGKPVELDLIERMEQMERLVAQLQDRPKS